jgi:hypothetical protein
MVLASAGLIGAPNALIILATSASHFPGIEKRRIRHDVIEAVTCAALAFDRIQPRRLLQPHHLFFGPGRRRDQNQCGKNRDPSQWLCSSNDSERQGLNKIMVIACWVLDQLLGLGLADLVGGAGGE